jgi:hypothetical protein
MCSDSGIKEPTRVKDLLILVSNFVRLISNGLTLISDKFYRPNIHITDYRIINNDIQVKYIYIYIYRYGMIYNVARKPSFFFTWPSCSEVS